MHKEAKACGCYLVCFSCFQLSTNHIYQKILVLHYQIHVQHHMSKTILQDFRVAFGWCVGYETFLFKWIELTNRVAVKVVVYNGIKP